MVIDLAEIDITLAEMVWPFRPKKVTSAYVALAEMTIYPPAGLQEKRLLYPDATTARKTIIQHLMTVKTVEQNERSWSNGYSPEKMWICLLW